MIVTKNIIINEASGAIAANPWECDYFEHTIIVDEDVMEKGYVNTPCPDDYEGTNDEWEFDEHIEWSLTGDVPLKLTIDKVTGVISGKISMLTDKQPGVTEFFPKEVIKEDGSNRTNTGRYKNATHEFTFEVRRKISIKIKNECKKTPSEDYNYYTEEHVSTVKIIVVKNNDIDNTIFCRDYLEAGYMISVDDKEFRRGDLLELLEEHPGPFKICEE